MLVKNQKRANVGHDPEPWRLVPTGVVNRVEAANGEVVCGSSRGGSDRVFVARGVANLERAADCVNACRGINPEAVPAMLEALRSVRLWHARRTPEGFRPIEDQPAGIADAMLALELAEGGES